MFGEIVVVILGRGIGLTGGGHPATGSQNPEYVPKTSQINGSK